MRPMILLGLAASAVLSLAACSTGGGVTPPVVSPPQVEDRFGAAFGRDYRAPSTAEPAPVNDGDVIPPDPGAEPLPV